MPFRQIKRKMENNNCFFKLRMSTTQSAPCLSGYIRLSTSYNRLSTANPLFFNLHDLVKILLNQLLSPLITVSHMLCFHFTGLSQIAHVKSLTNAFGVSNALQAVGIPGTRG